MGAVKRRSFMAASAGCVLSAADLSNIPIIDTHIHLFDPTRPQGVPWPAKDQTAIFKPALPDRYRKLTAPFGIKGAIEIEASPWLEDNQWVLDIAAGDPIVVGTIGNLEPGKPDFAKNLERFGRNKLFRGIRYGNLWARNMGDEVVKPEFIADLKRLAAADMTLDTANPTPDLIYAVVRATDAAPDLRVVLDHLPQLTPPADAAALRSYRANLTELGKRPRVYVKLSSVFRRNGNEVPRDLSHYRATLDEIMGVFGDDRVLYGSDWPNSDQWRPYNDVIGIVREYFAGKSRTAAEKYFWKNSVAAYKWIKRDVSQPG
jgi:predicted TIM-barrel fold metal-dependent hydrolase